MKIIYMEMRLLDKLSQHMLPILSFCLKHKVQHAIQRKTCYKCQICHITRNQLFCHIIIIPWSPLPQEPPYSSDLSSSWPPKPRLSFLGLATVRLTVNPFRKTVDRLTDSLTGPGLATVGLICIKSLFFLIGMQENIQTIKLEILRLKLFKKSSN